MRGYAFIILFFWQFCTFSDANAKAVKLNAFEAGKSVSQPVIENAPNIKTNLCQNDSYCPAEMKCVSGKCVSACLDVVCQNPSSVCEAIDHKGVCSDCPAGQKLSPHSASTCLPCEIREKCSCPGVGFSDGNGHCTSDTFSCPPGSKQNMLTFTCNICLEDEEECNCPLNFIADGKNGCKPKPLDPVKG